MRDLPAAADKDARRALRRLQEVGVHVIAPAAALAAAPLPGAVALVPLRDALAGRELPEGAARVAVEIDGTETEEQIGAAASTGAVVALLNVKDGVSRVHASRRVFEALKRAGGRLPVVHHIRFPEGAVRDEVVINTGSMVRLWVCGWVGGLFQDALGVLYRQHEKQERGRPQTPAIPTTPSSLPPHPPPPTRTHRSAACWWTAWATAPWWRPPRRTSSSCAPPRLACCRCAGARGARGGSAPPPCFRRRRCQRVPTPLRPLT